MKYILTFICSTFFTVLICYSQDYSAKLKIDKKLNYHLFEFLPYGVHGDPNSDLQQEFVSNADITEPNKHRAFDTCRSYFQQDTLIIEFGSITPFFTDKLVLKIKNKNYWSYLINEDAGIKIIGQSKSLLFRKKINRKGQEIFGVLTVEFLSENLNKTFLYSGSFRCVVE